METDPNTNIAALMKFPTLSKDAELDLAHRWIKKRDEEARQKLIESHLKLVVKIAFNYTKYKLPIQDLIQEGCIGLAKAVDNFNPDKGFRLSTYAAHWIRSFVVDYVLKNLRLVKLTSRAENRRNFFRLIKFKAQRCITSTLSHEEAEEFAREYTTDVDAVLSLDPLITFPSFSLDAPMGNDNSGNDRASDFHKIHKDESAPTEEDIVAGLTTKKHAALLHDVIASSLNERERDIFTRRRLADPPITLFELSGKHGVSRERIRQIEVRAFEKIRDAMMRRIREQMCAAPTMAPSC